jgi:hypothetical protein
LPPAYRHLNLLLYCWILVGIIYQIGGLESVDGAEISHLIIASSRDHLLLSVNLRDVVIGDCNAAPAADLSATIIFSIALNEVRPIWFNKKIVHHTAINTIKHYPEKNEYRLLQHHKAHINPGVLQSENAHKHHTRR